MRIVLLGDLHFYTLGLMPQHLLSKRLLGHTNLLLRRRKHFKPELFDAVAARVQKINPDGILMVGDFTTTALPKEFELARQALLPICQGKPVFGVAGNHDRYTFKAAADHRCENALPGWLPNHTPTVEQLTPNWRLMRIDSAVPRRLSSSGMIGEEQLEEVSKRLKSLTPEQGLVVLCHYPCVLPPNVTDKSSHALVDAEDLQEALEGSPAKIVFVHGHIHKPWRYDPSQGSPFLSINSGAPCHVSGDHPAGQGFWEIDLPDDPRSKVRLLHHRPVSRNGGVAWDTAKA